MQLLGILHVVPSIYSVLGGILVNHKAKGA